MNRLLLVSYSWPPIVDVGVHRSVKLAKYLLRLGWEIRILTVSNPDGWRMLGPMETPPEVQVVRVHDPFRIDRFALAARKLIRENGHGASLLGTRGAIVPEVQAGWIPSASWAGTRLARRWGATHILATGPPFSSLIVGARIARATGLPLVSDFQDSWTIHPDTRYPTAIHRKVDEDLELGVMQESSILTTVTKTIAMRYETEGAEFQVIPNGVDAEDLPARGPGPPHLSSGVLEDSSSSPYEPPSPLRSHEVPDLGHPKVTVPELRTQDQSRDGAGRTLRLPILRTDIRGVGETRCLHGRDGGNEEKPRSLGVDHPFRIVYTGSFYPHTPPTTLLAAMQDGMEFHHYGRPLDFTRLGVHFRGEVTTHGFVPLKDAVRAAAEADLLYFLLPRHFGEALSDKLFTYIATGVPILAEIPDGEAKRLLQEWAPETAFVGPGDSRGMREALRSALSSPPRPNTRDGFLDRYGRDVIARKFDELLRSL